MHHPNDNRLAAKPVALLALALIYGLSASELAMAQSSSPFMTGATSLQTNILAWLTPVAIILIMVLGGMAMANRIIENCGNTLILRCSGSDNGGTAHFASRLIGEREILRRNTSRGSDREGILGAGTRRSRSTTENYVTELAVLPSQLEQLCDLTGYIKTASSRQWLKISFAPYSHLS
jgi:hypothetical protein